VGVASVHRGNRCITNVLGRDEIWIAAAQIDNIDALCLELSCLVRYRKSRGRREIRDPLCEKA
jgi:hypothetical protein